MFNTFKGWFIGDKDKVAGVAFVVVALIITEFVYCYVLTANNKKLKLENERLTISVQNPVVVEKPKVTIRYIERVVKVPATNGIPITDLTENITEIERDEGSTNTPLTPVPTEKKYSVGIEYQNDATIGIFGTKRVFKGIEIGLSIHSTPNVGIIGLIRF